MSTVRLRRLQADFDKVRDYVKRHPRLQLIQAEGTPPERYQLEYQIGGLRQKADGLEIVKSHLVELVLPLSYPRMPPQCRMLTPVFHPNIAPHAICIGDHWSPGEPLWSIIARIGEMIAFQSYNTRSPLNGEAARWVEEHVQDLPLDPVSLMPDEPSAGVERPESPPEAAASPQPAPQQLEPQHSPYSRPSPGVSAGAADGANARPAPAASVLACPSCGSSLRLTAEMAGKRIRCPRCQTILRAPAAISEPILE
jgi:ubiquitin-protein ligase